MKLLSSASVIFFSVLCLCCNDQKMIVAPDSAGSGRLVLSFAKAPAGIARITARLSRGGFDDRVMDLTVGDSGQSASGSFTSVPAGSWHLRVDALNDSGSVEFTGETDVDVVGGMTTHVALQLSPATGGIDIVVTWGTACTPTPDGLVSWWTGDGNANDQAGGNNGLLINGATFAEGKVGLSILLNGTDQFVRVPPSPSLNPSGSMTIEGWIFPSYDTNANIAARWGGSYTEYNQRGWQLSMFPRGILRFAVSDSAHQNDPPFHDFDSPPGVLNVGEWNHVAGVYDKSTGSRRIYVNARVVAERIDTPITIFPSISEITIGAILIPYSETYYAFFPGRIDELTFYDSALSQDELSAIYRAGGAGKCK